MREEPRALAVMYHYVRESRESSPSGIRPLRVAEFETQLDWLERNYRIVSAGEFLTALEDGLPSRGKPPCLLTFDDGTRDHTEIVLPILQRRSLSAVFFVLTWPSELQRMPTSHALHWVLGLPEEHVWAKLSDFAASRLGGIGALGSAEDAMTVYDYEDTALRARIKYAVNFALPAEAAEDVISQIVRERGTSLRALAGEWFLTDEDIRQLDASGMEVGSHGCSHRSLTQMGAAGIREELRHSSFYLTRLLGKAPSWFCCPFTGSDLSTDVAWVHEACREVGIKAVVTQQPTLVTPDTDAYSIPRYDCVALPPRTSGVR